MAFIYAADIYCDSCGLDIRDELTNSGKAPEHPENEATYDSDEYPKLADDDAETDSPQHCGSHADCLEADNLSDGSRVGKLIGTNLTDAGVDYVREAIEQGGLVADFWAEQFSDYF
jgi:hypothetical protein